MGEIADQNSVYASRAPLARLWSVILRIEDSGSASNTMLSSNPPLTKNNSLSCMLRISHPVIAAEIGPMPIKINMNMLIARPIISRDPVLFLRDRSSGFPAAFDRVLQIANLCRATRHGLKSLGS